jgi:hypothetical protein
VVGSELAGRRDGKAHGHGGERRPNSMTMQHGQGHAGVEMKAQKLTKPSAGKYWSGGERRGRELGRWNMR